jgi:hypothetical protein
MNVKAEFERCWPWLAAALEHAGPTHNKEHVWNLIESGARQFFPLTKGAFVTEIVIYPTGLKEAHLWLAGSDELNELTKAQPLLEAYFKLLGCHRGIMFARPGVKRKLKDYRYIGDILVKDLT